MAITTKPKTKVSPESVNDFISGAPDAAPAAADSLQGRRGKIAMKGKKAQITLTISPELLQHLDARAEKLGMTRTGLVVYAVNSLLGR